MANATRQMEPPAIVGIMARVWMWVAWLTVSLGAYSELIGYRCSTPAPNKSLLDGLVQRLPIIRHIHSAGRQRFLLADVDPIHRVNLPHGDAGRPSLFADAGTMGSVEEHVPGDPQRPIELQRDDALPGGLGLRFVERREHQPFDRGGSAG